MYDGSVAVRLHCGLPCDASHSTRGSVVRDVGRSVSPSAFEAVICMLSVSPETTCCVGLELASQ